MSAVGEKLERFIEVKAEPDGTAAKVKGLKRFERSDKGWPIVDISQLMK